MLKYIFFVPIVWLSTICFGQVSVTTFENTDTTYIDDGLVIGPDNYLYGSHFNGDRVYRVGPDGLATIFASGLVSPNGLEFDSEGNLFIADHLGNKIVKVSPAGVLTEHVGSLIKPSGILKMLDSDTMIVTRYEADLILKIAPDGVIDTLAQGGLLDGPVGLTYDDEGVLFCANFNDRRLIRIDLDGEQNELAQFPGTGWLGFMKYAHGSFYGTAYNQNKIYKIRQSDTLISLFAGKSFVGETDGDTSVATFNKPNGIAFNNAKDTMYISTYGTGNIRRITGYLNEVSLQKSMLVAQGISVFPNPASADNVQLLMYLDAAAQIKLTLTDENGKVVFQDQHLLVAGENNINIPLEGLNTGIYFLAISDDFNTIYKRLNRL